METSRIIRADTRYCQIYRPCCRCIARTYTVMCNTQSNTARKWHSYSVGIEI